MVQFFFWLSVAWHSSASAFVLPPKMLPSNKYYTLILGNVFNSVIPVSNLFIAIILIKCHVFWFVSPIFWAESGKFIAQLIFD